jgi:ribulose-5-phosphate 4-epimerase/fuculose-1-phosphate aldolase
MNETEARRGLVAFGASLFERGLTFGRTGNLSVRIDDRILITPTGGSLGALVEDDLSVIDIDGAHLDGARPSKEAPLHTAMYRARDTATAVVHLHSTYAVAVSCLGDVDSRDVLPPLTAYYVMRVGRLPLIGYHPPGSPTLAEEAATLAGTHHALLLANHGSIVAGTDLASAVDAVEELEQTAKLFLLLGERATRPLTPDQVAGLNVH